MVYEQEQDVFKIFLETHDATKVFKNALMEEQDIELEEYLSKPDLVAYEIVGSAFDFYRSLFPNDIHPFERAEYWRKLNSNWRAFLASVHHKGLPFMHENVL